MCEIKCSMFIVLWILMGTGCSTQRTVMGAEKSCQKRDVPDCVEEALRKDDALLAMQRLIMSENIEICGSAEYICGLIVYKGQQEAKKHMIDLEFNLAIRNREIGAVQPYWFNTLELIRCFKGPKSSAKSCDFAYIGKSGDSLWFWLDIYCKLLHFSYDVNIENGSKKIIVTIGPFEIMNPTYVRKSYVVPERCRSQFEHMSLPRELPCYETEGIAYVEGHLEIIGKNSKMFDILNIMVEKLK